MCWARGAAAVIGLLLLAVPADGGLVFRMGDDARFAPYISPRCTTFSSVSIDHFTVDGKATKVLNATYVHPDESICTGESGEKYKGMVMKKSSIEKVCRVNGDAQEIFVVANQLGHAAGLAAMVSIFDESNQKKVVVGFGWAGGASYSSPTEMPVPQVQCQWFEGEPELEAGYWDDQFMMGSDGLFNKSVRLDVTITFDPNPWGEAIETFWWQAFFRGWGIAYTATGAMALWFLKMRQEAKPKNKRTSLQIPEIVLLMEGIVLPIVGIHLMAGAFLGDSTYPGRMHRGGMFLFIGSSFATSVLSGMHFQDTVDKIKSMKTSSAGGSFFQRKRKEIALLIVACVAWDIFQIVAALLYIPHIELIAGGLVNVAQGITALIFLKMSFRFISFTTKALGAGGATNADKSKGPSKQMKQILRLAKFLMISALGMLLVIVIAPIGIVAGKVIYGFWSPGGWVGFWGTAIIGRFIPSWAQIMMARPSKKNKVVSKEMAPGTELESEQDTQLDDVGKSYDSSALSTANSEGKSGVASTTAGSSMQSDLESTQLESTAASSSGKSSSGGSSSEAP